MHSAPQCDDMYVTVTRDENDGEAKGPGYRKPHDSSWVAMRRRWLSMR